MCKILVMRIPSYAALAVVIALPLSAFAQAPVDPRPANNPEQKPAVAGQTDAPEKKSAAAFDVVTVVEGLQNPWAVAFLPGGKMLITERPGRLRVLSPDGKLSTPVSGCRAAACTLRCPYDQISGSAPGRSTNGLSFGTEPSG